MLFSRYSGNAYLILNMEFERGIEFYFKACNEMRNEKLFQRWINGYQSVISFDDFKKEVNGYVQETSAQDCNQSQEDILNKVKDIIGKGLTNGTI